MNENRKCLSSQLVQSHAEGQHNPKHAHTVPLYQTSTFVFDTPQHGAELFAGKAEGHIYSRLGNPTVQEFERMVALSEHADEAIAFGSGMAAICGAVMFDLKSGDHIVSGDTLYGCTATVFNDYLPRYGISVTFVDTSKLAKVKAAMKPETKLVYFETPANPSSKLSDIEEIAKIAHAGNALCVVDNTYSSPAFQNPIDLGADVSLHSVTKFLNGHGDVVGGVCVANKEVAAKIRKYRSDTGGIMGPFDAWLALRGMRTLSLRMDKHNENGLAVANYLKTHPKVKEVNHPGLSDFPGHELALKQMRGYGSCFSFVLHGGYDACVRFINALKLPTLAVSLGCLDTLIQHPASMTHSHVPAHLRADAGLTDDLVRISIGIEDANELIKDLEQALTHA